MSDLVARLRSNEPLPFFPYDRRSPEWIGKNMSTPIRFTDEPVFKHGLMTKGDDGFYYRKDLAPATARWSDFESGTQLAYTCPCGCGTANQIPVYAGGNGYGWKWNGNRDKPTLSPSIAQTTPCKWHGFLVDGEFRG